MRQKEILKGYHSSCQRIIDYCKYVKCSILTKWPKLYQQKNNDIIYLYVTFSKYSCMHSLIDIWNNTAKELGASCIYYHSYFTFKEVELLIQGQMIWVSAIEPRLLALKFTFASVFTTPFPDIRTSSGKNTGVDCHALLILVLERQQWKENRNVEALESQNIDWKYSSFFKRVHLSLWKSQEKKPLSHLSFRSCFTCGT